MFRRQNWIQLVSIQIGGAICLPVIIVGTILGQSYGLLSSIIAILLGNVFLAFMAMVMVSMTLRNRKTTMENAKEYFGMQGGILIAGIMLVSMTGWFAIQNKMMAESLVQLLGNQESGGMHLLLSLFIGGMITLGALRGMRALAFLSNLTVPFLIMAMGYAVWNSDPIDGATAPSLTFGAISIVMATGIACVIDLPTYFRHARHLSDGLISVALLFGVAIPMIEIVGVVITSKVTEGNLLQVFAGEGGVLIQGLMALFLLFAGWTTNAANLFSNVTCLKAIFPKIKEKRASILLGFAGSALSCLPLLDHFEVVLECMGVAVSSMGALIVVRFLVGQSVVQKEHSIHLVIWGVGTCLGLVSVLGLTVTAIPLLDAFLVTALVTCLKSLFFGGQYEAIDN